MRCNWKVVSLATAALCMAIQTCTAAQAPRQAKLPSGYYVYIGRQPGGSPPRYMIIGDDGSCRWDNPAGPVSGFVSLGNQGGSGVPAAQEGALNASRPPANAEYEVYEYPFIKWKPKLRPSGALFRLETRLDFNDASSGYIRRSRGAMGTLKYKLTVLVRGDNLLPAQGIRVELLDDKGFSLTTISIPVSEFSPITGTSLLEARGTTNMSEDDYQKAADYTVL